MRYQVDLSPYNTLRLPAFARQLLQVDTRQQLLEALIEHDQIKTPLLVLGGGSNVVLTQDVEGLCLLINSRGIEVQSGAGDSILVTVEAGEPWHAFVEHCLAQGWYGLENLALIPGTVGAAPIQNIGAYGVEVGQSIRHVAVWDRRHRQLLQLSNAQCRFGYRDSLFKGAERDRYVVVSVTFELSSRFEPRLSYGGLANEVTDAEPTARQVFEAVVRVRQQKLPDPLQLANAGSFFKNPVVSESLFKSLQVRFPGIVAYPDARGVKLAAGWLIDQAGWKGARRGAVGVHAQQALVLVNYGDATGAELLLLATQIQADIEQRFGVMLEIEPRII